MLSISYRSRFEGAFQTFEKWLQRTARAILPIFESAGEPASRILFEMVSDGVGMEVEDLGDKAVSSPFMIHPNDQEFGLILIGILPRVMICDSGRTGS